MARSRKMQQQPGSAAPSAAACCSALSLSRRRREAFICRPLQLHTLCCESSPSLPLPSRAPHLHPIRFLVAPVSSKAPSLSLSLSVSEQLFVPQTHTWPKSSSERRAAAGTQWTQQLNQTVASLNTGQGTDFRPFPPPQHTPPTPPSWKHQPWQVLPWWGQSSTEQQ